MSSKLDKAMKRFNRLMAKQWRLHQIAWAKRVLRDSAQLKVMLETQPEIRYKVDARLWRLPATPQQPPASTG